MDQLDRSKPKERSNAQQNILGKYGKTYVFVICHFIICHSTPAVGKMVEFKDFHNHQMYILIVYDFFLIFIDLFSYVSNLFLNAPHQSRSKIKKNALIAVHHSIAMD